MSQKTPTVFLMVTSGDLIREGRLRDVISSVEISLNFSGLRSSGKFEQMNVMQRNFI